MKNNFLIFAVVIMMCAAADLINAETGVEASDYRGNVLRQGKEKPLKIKDKPQVSSDVFSKCSKDSLHKGLLVRMRVVFESSAQIGAVEIVQATDCDFFNEETLRVAKKIKFKPAMRDDEPITVTKIIEYNASVY